MKHLVIFSEGEVESLVRGTQNFVFRFYSKRPDFLAHISLGDTIYFRKRRGEALGQFEVGKILVIENLEVKDWGIIKSFVENSGENLNEVTFKSLSQLNNTLLIVQIRKLEQFIASPIEKPKKSKKDWIVLG